MANSEILDEQIRMSRELLQHPECKVLQDLAKAIAERLNNEILSLPPIPDNLYKLNELYGRRVMLCDLFVALDTLGNKNIYKTNEETLIEQLETKI